MKNNKLLWSLCILILFTLVFSGCEEEYGLLHQYAGGRLGVILETEETTFGPELTSSLLKYIKRRVDLQVVNPDLLAGSEPYRIGVNDRFYREQLGLDLLLFIKLTDLHFEDNQPSLSVKPEQVRVTITSTCTLTLAYHLRDLHSAETIYLGQSRGYARDSKSIKAGKYGVHFDFREIDRYNLIEEAMLDAVRETELL
ncbi:MAG: hypothetical protein GX050_07810 [Firmicutes bacterium]|nr:hypothetical protein [Bacillota bacterium]